MMSIEWRITYSSMSSYIEVNLFSRVELLGEGTYSVTRWLKFPTILLQHIYQKKRWSESSLNRKLFREFFANSSCNRRFYWYNRCRQFLIIWKTWLVYSFSIRQHVIQFNNKKNIEQIVRHTSSKMVRFVERKLMDFAPWYRVSSPTNATTLNDHRYTLIWLQATFSFLTTQTNTLKYFFEAF